MYRLYRITERPEGNSYFDTGMLFYNYQEFENELAKNKIVYNKRKWRLLPDTGDIIDIDLTQKIKVTASNI